MCWFTEYFTDSMEHYTQDTAVSEGLIAKTNGQSEESETIPDGQEDRLFSRLGLELGNVTIMGVKNGSKVRNLLGFAFKHIKSEDTRHIIFTGSGPAISKTITCVEIVKRNLKNLHQVNKIFYKRIAEYWNPEEDSLDRLKVTRHIPAIAILLSKDHLSYDEPGYQAPGSSGSILSSESGAAKKTNKSRKRTNTDKTKQGKKIAPSSLTLKSCDGKIAGGNVEGLRRKLLGKRKSTGNTKRKSEES